MEINTFKLKEICKIKSGKRIPLGMDYTLEVTSHPYIRARDIKNGIIKTDDLIYLEDAVYNKIKKYIINNGDVAITIVGASVGDIAYANSEVDGYNLTENAIRLTEFSDIINSRYVFYQLSQKTYYDYMQLIAGASAQPKLGIYKIERIRVNLPSKQYQDKIVNILSTYDNLIELNTKRIKTLEQMAENLYKEWFVRFRFPGHENAEFENGIPKGWEIKRLNTIADIVMGQSPESSLYNMEKQGLPFHQGVGSYGEYYLKDEVYSTGGNKRANPNSIIFSVRAPVGRINITLNTIILGRGVASINSKTDNNGFLYWLLKFKFHQEDLIGNGSIFSSVTKKELDNQKFIIPPKDIIHRFDDFAKLIEKNMRVLYLNNENLIKQRNLLLPRLMSGKLEV